MADYITNSKNRKLKKRIENLISRVGFWAGKLPLSGRFILLLTGILFLSLFFPWLELRLSDNSVQRYFAFSQYTGYVGYGILIASIIIPFFLLSHTKKEFVRAYVPFRLSDTQAVVFIASMIFVALIQFLFTAGIYNQIALGGVEIQNWFFVAITTVLLIIVAGFWLSKNMKKINTEMYYLDHAPQEKFGEYQDILRPKTREEEEEKKRNMSLPI